MSDIEYSVITSDVIKSFDCIMENGVFALGANAPFSIIFSKVFKTLRKFFLLFFNISKNRK